jgi:hypothetical protein
MISKALLMAVLPLAVRWATSKERRILEQGVALTPAQLEDARRVGVIEAKRVRLQAVDQIPWPVHPMLRQAAEATGLLSPDTIGLTLRYGIFIRADHWNIRRLVVHELVHAAQYERLGGIRPFLKVYLHECLTSGYPFGSLEREARRMENEICGDRS